MSNQNNQSQEPMSKEDLQTYMKYIMTGNITDGNHAKELRRLSRRTTTMSDVTVIIRVLMQQQDQMITQLMDVAQVQQRVIQKLGASEGMFKEAQEEYEAEIVKAKEEVKKQQAMMKDKETKEADIEEEK